MIKKIYIIDSLKSEVEMQNVSGDDKLGQSVGVNVIHQIKNISNEVLKEEITRGEIRVIDARYDLDDGSPATLKLR